MGTMGLFLAESSGTAYDVVTTGFEAGLADIQTAVLNMFNSAMGPGMVIAGVGIAVSLGVKYFRKIAK